MEDVFGAESFTPAEFIAAMKMIDITIGAIFDIIILVAAIAVYTAVR